MYYLQPHEGIGGNNSPLIVGVGEGTAVAVFSSILDQAEARRRAQEVAAYLVGAKLELRFGDGVVTSKCVDSLPINGFSDFRIGDAAIQVTTKCWPDKMHLNQIGRILNDTDLQVWVLPRLRDRERWRSGIEVLFQDRADRIVVTGVELFLGQNVSELGKFRNEDVRGILNKLFERYESVWLPRAGSSGLRIMSPEA
jgi:hypothetical protein